MRKLFLLQNVSIDGFFEGPNHDLSWFKGDFEAFNSGESATVDSIMFGHTTFDMMKQFWPTPQAAQIAPDVATFMNDRQKYVASHTSFEPGWDNSTVMSGDVIEEVRAIKNQTGGDIILMGSNQLCVSLMQAGLVDEFQIIVNPVVLGSGRTLFQGIENPAPLTLKETRPFPSGAVLHVYAPAS